MFNKRKAQMALFVLVGIVLIMVGFIGMQAYRQQKGWGTTGETPKTAVTDYIETCLKGSAADAVRRVALQGGYSTLPAQVDYPEGFPSAMYIDVTDVPTEAELAQQIAEQITDTLPSCIDSDRAFAARGIQITQGSPSVQASLNEDGVRVQLTLPIEVRYDGGKVAFSAFSAEVAGLPIKKLRRVSENLTKEFFNGNGGACLSCAIKLRQTENVAIEFGWVDGKTVRYEITDLDSGEATELRYRFAVRRIPCTTGTDCARGAGDA